MSRFQDESAEARYRARDQRPIAIFAPQASLLHDQATDIRSGVSMGNLCRINALLVLAVLAAPASAERAYTPEVSVARYVSTHDVRDDGSDRETTEFVLRIETPQGVSDEGAERISYRSGIDEVESIEASTIKRDGTEIKVPESAIRTQDEDSDGGTTEFSDTKYVPGPRRSLPNRVSCAGHVRPNANRRDLRRGRDPLPLVL